MSHTGAFESLSAQPLNSSTAQQLNLKISRAVSTAVVVYDSEDNGRVRRLLARGPQRKDTYPMVSFGKTSVASETQTLKVGDQAPDFQLPGHRGGETFRLSDLRGRKNLVIVFYPLDWTPV